MRLTRYWKLVKWNVWSPRNEPLPENPTRNWRISLCTTCMGRAADLMRTLPVNIKDNEDYLNLEFVVLNYNSKDDLHDFMMSPGMREHLESGKVRYLRTKIPRFYSMSHSRNIAFLNSTGNIVMNLDADNYTGPEFASYVNKLANIRQEKVIFARGKRRIEGRIGMFIDEFRDIGGYDEDLEGYGGDDHSLLIRAICLNFVVMWWRRSPVDCRNRIVTPRDVVGANMANPDWQETERINRNILLEQLRRGEFIANKDCPWGQVEDLEVFSGGHMHAL